MYRYLSLLCLFFDARAQLMERTTFFYFSTNDRLSTSSISCEQYHGHIQIVEISYRVSDRYGSATSEICYLTSCRSIDEGSYYDGRQIECQNENVIRSKCSGGIDCDLTESVIMQPAHCSHARIDKPSMLAVRYYCVPYEHSINLCSTMSNLITLNAGDMLYINSPAQTRASRCSCDISPLPDGWMKVALQPFYQISTTDELRISVPSVNRQLPFISRSGSQLPKAYSITRSSLVQIILTTKTASSSSLSVNRIHLTVNDSSTQFTSGLKLNLTCNGGLPIVNPPQPVTTENNKIPGNDNTVVIVLAVIFSILLVAASLIAGFCIWRRREKIRRRHTELFRSTSSNGAHNNNQPGGTTPQKSTVISGPIGPVTTTDTVRFEQITNQYHTLDNRKPYGYSTKEEPTYNEIDEDRHEYRRLCDAEGPNNIRMRSSPDGSEQGHGGHSQPYLVSYIVDRTPDNPPSPLSQVDERSENQSEAVYAEPLEPRVNSQVRHYDPADDTYPPDHRFSLIENDLYTPAD